LRLATDEAAGGRLIVGVGSDVAVVGDFVAVCLYRIADEDGTLFKSGEPRHGCEYQTCPKTRRQPQSRFCTGRGLVFPMTNCDQLESELGIDVDVGVQEEDSKDDGLRRAATDYLHHRATQCPLPKITQSRDDLQSPISCD